MSTIKTLSSEEMELLAKRPSDILRELVEQTGNQTLIDAVNQYIEMRGMADLGARTWLTKTMSALYRNCGPEAVQESLMSYFGPLYANAADFWEMDFHDRVLESINMIREGLDSSVEIVDEDEEKLRFRMTPCQSGQKLYESGLYDGENGCAKCSAHIITGQREDFPVYCTHNPIMDLASIEACGYPKTVTEYPDDMCSCSCTYVVYKRKEDIPESYFTRIGKEKPSK